MKTDSHSIPGVQLQYFEIMTSMTVDKVFSSSSAHVPLFWTEFYIGAIEYLHHLIDNDHNYKRALNQSLQMSCNANILSRIYEGRLKAEGVDVSDIDEVFTEEVLAQLKHIVPKALDLFSELQTSPFNANRTVEACLNDIYKVRESYSEFIETNCRKYKK